MRESRSSKFQVALAFYLSLDARSARKNIVSSAVVAEHDAGVSLTLDSYFGPWHLGMVFPRNVISLAQNLSGGEIYTTAVDLPFRTVRRDLRDK